MNILQTEKICDICQQGPPVKNEFGRHAQCARKLAWAETQLHKYCEENKNTVQEQIEFFTRMNADRLSYKGYSKHDEKPFSTMVILWAEDMMNPIKRNQKAKKIARFKLKRGLLKNDTVDFEKTLLRFADAYSCKKFRYYWEDGVFVGFDKIKKENI